MTKLEFESKSVGVGDRVYVQYASGVVRSGVFLGVREIPALSSREGVCITYDAQANIIDWIDLAYVAELAVTIPRAIVEDVVSKPKYQAGNDGGAP